MPQLIKELLNSKILYPSAEELSALTSRWRSLQNQRGHLEGIALGEADIALRYIIPGGASREH